MSQDQVISICVSAMELAMKVAMPLLLVGLVVGLLVSIFQAATQIQEQTLTFIPKIVAMVASAILLLPWMGQHLMDYAQAIFGSHPLP
jgi:flagellar biosynthesis protein FliQ